MKIAIIGNYPPRRCGIATFTQNFVEALLADKKNSISSKIQIDVFAMDDNKDSYDYPKIVKQSIRQNHTEDYFEIVNIINEGNYDYCYIQHEFGIFGGHSGLFVNIFLSQIKTPIFITLHSVLKELNFHQKRILENMVLFSTQLVVMSEFAREILIIDHHISDKKISVIPHGVPVFKSSDTKTAKEDLGWQDYTILMTFGLIGQSKGIEIAIKALPKVCKAYPEVRYIILGKTHPHIVENEGEAYRESLIKLSKELGVSKNIFFLDKYVSETELKNYLQACDIYITPYLNEAQITSGTLSYAVSSGSAVISTPYWHAIELLANERGILFDFNCYADLESELMDLLSNTDKLHSIQQSAFKYGQTFSWPTIGTKTHKIIRNILTKNTINKSNTEEIFLSSIPEFSLNHINSLIDSTGLLQHSTYNIPDFKHGYCTDDNARALILAIKLNLISHSKDNELLITKFLSFLNYMQIESGTFINMLSYSRQHLQNNKSEDTFGRAIWALGYTIKYAPLLSQKEFALKMFLKALPTFASLKDLRGIANSIIGIVYFLEEHKNDKTTEAILQKLLSKLYDSYKLYSDNSWKWYDDKIAYDNAILPLSMFYGASYFKISEYFKTAMDSLTFLEAVSYKDNHLSLIGNEKWLEKGEPKSLFCQQPIDAMAFTLIYQYLYKLTNKNIYKDKLRKSFTWFLGNNDLFTSLYDRQTEACADGLFKDNINLNQGAESNLAWLIAYLNYKYIDIN